MYCVQGVTKSWKLVSGKTKIQTSCLCRWKEFFDLYNKAISAQNDHTFNFELLVREV